MKRSRTTRARKAGLLAFGAATSLYAASAAAQSAQASAPTAADDSENVTQEVVVTGTAIRGVKPAGSATLSVDVSELKGAGLTNPSDLKRVVPQLQTSNFIETSAASNSNSTKGSTFNLRGLGAPGTLVLVDGHRVVQNGTATPYYDANNIPFVALQRIEVVTDGASAIYGADAVGGVVNFILKKNFRGAEVSARMTDQLGHKTFEFTGGAGTTWTLGGEKGSIFVSGSYQTRDNIPRSASKFLSTNLAPLGGNDARVVNGVVQSNGSGTLAIASTTPGQFLYYQLPANKSTGLTFADLTPGLGNIAQDADQIDYLGLEHRFRGSVVVSQDLNDWLTASFTGIYNKRDTKSFGTNFASRYVSITLTPASRYFITGIPNSRGNETVNQEFHGFYQNVSETTFDATLGLGAKLGAWRADAYATFGRNSACGNCIDNEVINQAVGTKVASGLINPYGPFPDSIQALATGPRFDRGIQRLGDEVLKFNGPLFSLPAGSVRAAVGMEFQQQYFSYSGSSANNPQAVPMPARPAVDGNRGVRSFFGEINIPLISDDMKLPLIRALNLNVADREDHYSDVGRANSPKVGATLELEGDFKLRGTYGKSFRAPSLQEANPGTLGNTLFGVVTNGTNDPRIPITNVTTGTTTVLYIAGGNGNLQPEKATTYSFGVDWAPSYIRGLTASLTYYNITYTNRINTPTQSYLANATNEAIYAPYIFPIAAQPASCISSNPSTFSAELQGYLALAPYRDAGTPGCDARAVLDIRSQNIGKTAQDGLDGQIDYHMDTSFGGLGAGLRVTKILSYKEAVVATLGLIDRLNQIGFPVSTRGYGYVGGEFGPFTANVGINYIGGYTNTTPITVAGVARPVAKVPSWTTFDFNASVKLPDSWKWVGDTRLSLSILNIADKDPPIVLAGANAFDPLNANPFGRIVQLELRKSF